MKNSGKSLLVSDYSRLHRGGYGDLYSPAAREAGLSGGNRGGVDLHRAAHRAQMVRVSQADIRGREQGRDSRPSHGRPPPEPEAASGDGQTPQRAAAS